MAAPAPKQQQTYTCDNHPKDYSCANPPERPMTIKEVMDLLQCDPNFQRFFSMLLCRANKGDKRALACIKAFYRPSRDELENFCLDDDMIKRLGQCTDHNLLIMAPAYYTRSSQSKPEEDDGRRPRPC